MFETQQEEETQKVISPRVPRTIFTLQHNVNVPRVWGVFQSAIFISSEYSSVYLLWLVRAARVPVPQLLQGQDLLLEGVLEHEVHEGVGHLNTTTSVNMKNIAVNKISYDFTIFRGHSLLKALWIAKILIVKTKAGTWSSLVMAQAGLLLPRNTRAASIPALICPWK